MHMPLWAELLLRSAVLLGAAEVLRRLSHRRSAAARHKLLLGAFALLAVFPVLFVLLPEIRVPVVSRPAREASVTVTQTFAVASGRASGAAANWPLRIWLAGVFCALLPTLVGLLATRRVVRSAEPLEDAGWRDLAGTFARGREIPLLLSSKIAVPLTCCIVRPCILLPTAAREWSELRRQSVLAHELAHIERRDVLTQLAAHVVAALWWFQPLAWLLRRGLRTESELACDAAALASGVLPSAYAAELLAIAQDARRAGYANAVAISMARRGDLETRLHSILRPSRALLGPARAGSLIALLTAIAVGSSTLTANPNSTSPHTGGLHMKRTFLAALLTSTGLSAATISGSVTDPRGAALADARLTLVNPDNEQKSEAVSNADGSFALPELRPGDYILRVEEAGFKPFLSAFHIEKDDAVIKRALTLRADDDEHNPAASAAAGHIRVGGEVAESNLVHKVPPVYPKSAKEARLQGTVEISATISKEGVPLELQVVRSPGADLSESALEAVRQWRYRPVMLNGQPVEITTDIVVTYTLSQ